MGPGPVWTCEENLDLTEIRSPDRPARSQSLYRLRYPAHYMRDIVTENAVKLELFVDIFFYKVTSKTKGIFLYYI